MKLIVLALLGLLAASQVHGAAFTGPVRVWTEPNFWGSYADYGISVVNQLPTKFNHSISSIQVMPGHDVKVFDGFAYTGASASFRASYNDLGHLPTGFSNWNNRIQSMKITAISDASALLYEDCEYSCSYATSAQACPKAVILGEYNNLAQTGFGAGGLSAIHIIKPNRKFIGYTGLDFTGSSYSVTNSGTTCMYYDPVLKAFNDKTMSFRLVDTAQTTGNIAATLKLYLHCNFWGEQLYGIPAATKRLEVPDAAVKGFPLKQLSGAKVPVGYKLLVFAAKNYKGYWFKLTGDVNCLDYFRNDIMQSFKVVPEAEADPTVNSNVQLRQNCDANGVLKALVPGDYNNLVNAGFPDNDLSSMVSGLNDPAGTPPWRITLYQYANFAGLSKTMDATGCLWVPPCSGTTNGHPELGCWANTASSVKIRMPKYA